MMIIGSKRSRKSSHVCFTQFYLDGTPVNDSSYSRFQVKIDNKWTDVNRR